MMRSVLLFALLAAAGRADIIDGIAVVVGRKAITWSDVWRETRLEAYLNQRPFPPRSRNGPEVRRTIERLIEHSLIRQEMEKTAFPFAGEAQARQWLEKIAVDGSLASYGLRQKDLLDYALRQVDFMNFVELRFKVAVRVTPAEVEEYYKNSFIPELKRKGIPQPPPLEEIRDRIEDTLKEERTNELLEQWLVDQRARVWIQITGAEKP